MHENRIVISFTAHRLVKYKPDFWSLARECLNRGSYFQKFMEVFPKEYCANHYKLEILADFFLQNSIRKLNHSLIHCKISTQYETF